MDARTHVKHGNEHFAQGKYLPAIEEYTNAIELDPSMEPAYAGRAVAYLALGKRKLEGLVESVQDALIASAKGDPRRSAAAGGMGPQLDIADCRRRAREDFDKALELDPNDADVHYNRGTFWTEVFAHEPTTPADSKPPGKENWFFQRALADFSRAIELNPQFAKAYCNRAYLFMLIRDDKQGIADLSRALDLVPHDTWALTQRGLMYADMGQFAQALADFNRIISLFPDDPDGYRCRGMVYRDTGERVLAIRDFRRVLELSNDLSLRKKAEDNLRALGG